MAWYQHWVFNQPQVVVKLHAILRPFLLRRLKTDVEQMLPRKKEIILYATLTEHQKKFQDHLINKTLEGYLREKMDTGIRLFSIDFLLILNQAWNEEKRLYFLWFFFWTFWYFFWLMLGTGAAGYQSMTAPSENFRILAVYQLAVRIFMPSWCCRKMMNLEPE